jgi:ankyrin repeat protein
MPIVKLLLDAGADVNSPNGWALQTAAAEGHYEIVELLLTRGANVNATTLNENFPQQTALQGACEFGREDIVSLLLQHNADPNLGGGEDAPPILAAAMYGEEKILTKLVDAKANVNVSGGDDDSTPLINAAACIPGVECLKKLLDAGANINLADSDGNTALIAAAEAGDEDVVQFLLDHGADIMHSNHEGKNALQVALEEEEQDCVEVLVKHISIILAALKGAMDAGNAEVIGVVRNATASGQGLNYDDDTHHGGIQSSTEQRGGAESFAPDKNQSEYGQKSQYEPVRRNTSETYPGRHLVESYATGIEAQRTTFQQTQTTMEFQTAVSKQSYGQPPITPPQQQMNELRSYQQVASVQQATQSYPAKVPDPWNQERNHYVAYAGQPAQSLAEQQAIKRKPAPILQGGEQFRSTPSPPNQAAGSTSSFGAPAPTYAAYRPGVESTPSRKDQYTTYSQNLRQDPEPITVSQALPPNRPPYITTQSQPTRPAPGPSASNSMQDISLYDGSQYGPLEVPYEDDAMRGATRYASPPGLRIQTPQPAGSQNGIKAYPGALQRPYPQKSHTSPGPTQNYPDPWGNQERPGQAAQHQGYVDHSASQYPNINRPRQDVPPQRSGFFGN